MMKLKFVARSCFTLGVSAATPCVARPLVRMAVLQLVPPRAKPTRMGIIGIARYSSSLRLALHPMGRTAHDVQLRFLGLIK